MAPLRARKSCAKLKGVAFYYVGSFGREPNWFARPVPSRVSDVCRRQFVTALAKVRQEFDLAFAATPEPAWQSTVLAPSQRDLSSHSEVLQESVC